MTGPTLSQGAAGLLAKLQAGEAVRTGDVASDPAAVRAVVGELRQAGHRLRWYHGTRPPMLWLAGAAQNEEQEYDHQ